MTTHVLDGQVTHLRDDRMASQKESNMIDCMSCLIQHANGLSRGGTYTDRNGVTHGTLKWLGKPVMVCTLLHDDYNGRREWFVADTTVRV